jgi:hypothetical protein
LAKLHGSNIQLADPEPHWARTGEIASETQSSTAITSASDSQGLQATTFLQQIKPN